MIHFGVSELAHHRARQHPLDENVVAQNHVFAGRRTKAAERIQSEFREITPHQWYRNGFHISDALNAVTMLLRPIEAEHGTPIMDHEDDFVAQFEFLPKREKKAAMCGIGVTVGAGIWQLRGIAHTNQVAGDEAAEATTCRHHIAPEIRRDQAAVLEDDRSAFTLIDIGHAMAFDLDELLFSER